MMRKHMQRVIRLCKGGKRKMEKKNQSDLEKMEAERAKADAEYIESRDALLNFHRMMREGVNGVDDLVTYLAFVIQDAKHMEDIGRMQNNPILYSEAIAIHREFEKLLNLVMFDGTAEQVMDGTEEAHRENNKGEEGYV